MKKILTGLLLLIVIPYAKAQESQRKVGVVSYVTSRNIYVRFDSTINFVPKDTLLAYINNHWVKALVVENVSSKSAITHSIMPNEIVVETKVAYFLRVSKPEFRPDSMTVTKIDKKKIILNVKEEKSEEPQPIKQTHNGRLSVSSNGSMNPNEKSYNRLRTSFSMQVNRINGGKWSYDNYFIYSKKLGGQILENTFKDDFKVYTLAMTYDMTEKTRLSFGRKINLHLANMGAIDGIQVEHLYKKVIFGAFGGTRPDDQNYSFNASLFQIGGFVSFEKENKNGQTQTSMAFAEQKNQGKTDRRFTYFQHSSSLAPNLHLFYSLELDLFQLIDSLKSNQVHLTSTYLSLRYKPFKKLNITAAYDNRRNIIYYETYRSFLEQLLNQETRQGGRLNLHFSPAKLVSMNISGFYRYQSNRPQPTKNYVANLNFNQIPKLLANLTLSANYMNTYYFNGTIASVRLIKDLFKSKVNMEANYQKIDYTFVNKEQAKLKQNIYSFSANIFLTNKSSLLFSWEGTVEPARSYNRYFVTFNQRFRSKYK